jgi:NAD+ synthase (glutamine-hydrolysing)
MPGPASSERTQDNATLLAEALGTTHKVIPIGDMARTLLASIGHDLETEDITYENTQARMRKSVTMNYANMIHGFDLGTGDMSEITIGWSTYNGDHMSMYNPNGGVPKTLVKHLVQWYAENRADAAGRAVLLDILDTPISPELTGKGDLSQTTEDIVGPYPLIDFFTYEHLRYGSRPSKIGYLACRAFEGVYTEAEIDRRLGQFFVRHTKSQWKRDVTTNTIKLGTVSESSRGDLRMAANTDPEWHE